jgi:hypothetical protein
MKMTILLTTPQFGHNGSDRDLWELEYKNNPSDERKAELERLLDRHPASRRIDGREWKYGADTRLVGDLTPVVCQTGPTVYLEGWSEISGTSPTAVIGPVYSHPSRRVVLDLSPNYVRA